MLSDDARRRSRHCQITVIIFCYHSSFFFWAKVDEEGYRAPAHCREFAKCVYVWPKITHENLSLLSRTERFSSGILQYFFHSVVVVINAFAYSFHFSILLSYLLLTSDIWWNGFGHFSAPNFVNREVPNSIHVRTKSLNEIAPDFTFGHTHEFYERSFLLFSLPVVCLRSFAVLIN